MRKKRRNLPGEFKAKVALAALRGDKRTKRSWSRNSISRSVNSKSSWTG